MIHLKKGCMKPLTRFGVHILIPIAILILFTVTNLWSSKYICDGNIHLWHHKCSLPSTKVLGFVVFSLTSKIIGMVSPDPSWGDVKTIKSGKISALGSDISDKQSIVYTSALI